MRFQLAGTDEERGGEAANNLSRRDLGASKYPPRAKSVRVRASFSPLPLLLSWATRGNNIGKWSTSTLFYSQAYARVSRKAGTDASKQINMQVFSTASGSVFS